MTRASKIIIGLAVFTAVIPLLGFPGVVKDAFTIIAGLAIAAITYWADKHAKFCPECKLPEDTPHDHAGKESSLPAEHMPQGVVRTAISSPVSVGPDITQTTMNDARAIVERKNSREGMSSPSPFSFDAKKKPQKNSRNERRKEVAAI